MEKQPIVQLCFCKDLYMYIKYLILFVQPAVSFYCAEIPLGGNLERLS